MSFLDASEKAREHDRREVEEQQKLAVEHARILAAAAEKAKSVRRLRFGLVVVAGLALLATAVGAWAIQQRFVAGQALKVSVAGQLAAQSMLTLTGSGDVEQSVLLAADSLQRWSRFDSDRAVRGATALLPHRVAHFKYSGPISAVAFSQDGRGVFTAIENGTPSVFELASGKRIAQLAHQGTVTTTAISANGRWVVTSGQGNLVRVFDAASGEEVAQFLHQAPILALAISSDRRRVITGGSDKIARVFDTATGQETARLVHDDPINAVAINIDGRWAATGAGVPNQPDQREPPARTPNDNTARVFDATSGKEICRLQHLGAVRSVSLSADGQLLATGSEDSTARVFEIYSGREVSRLTHQGAVLTVASTADGRLVATSSEDKTTRMFEAASGNEVARLRQEGVSAVAFSADGRLVATGSRDGRAHVFEATDSKEVWRLTNARILYSLYGSSGALSPDGRWVVVDGKLIEVASGKEVDLDGTARAAAFSADGLWVATIGSSGGEKATATLFQLRDNKPIARFPVTNLDMLAVALSADARRIFLYSGFGALSGASQLVDVAGKKEMWPQPITGVVYAVAMSTDGRWLATGSASEVRIFDAAKGTEVVTLPHPANVRAIAFSADGRWMATGAEDNTARLWNVETRQLVSFVALHQGAVVSVAFASDGKQLATGSEDKTARVFEVPGLKEVSRMTLGGSAVEVRFLEQGRYLMTASLVKTASYSQDLILRLSFGHRISSTTPVRASRAISLTTNGSSTLAPRCHITKPVASFPRDEVTPAHLASHALRQARYR
jgi:WD40 repeat protein